MARYLQHAVHVAGAALVLDAREGWRRPCPASFGRHAHARRVVVLGAARRPVGGERLQTGRHKWPVSVGPRARERTAAGRTPGQNLSVLKSKVLVSGMYRPTQLPRDATFVAARKTAHGPPVVQRGARARAGAGTCTAQACAQAPRGPLLTLSELPGGAGLGIGVLDAYATAVEAREHVLHLCAQTRARRAERAGARRGCATTSRHAPPLARAAHLLRAGADAQLRCVCEAVAVRGRGRTALTAFDCVAAPRMHWCQKQPRLRQIL